MKNIKVSYEYEGEIPSSVIKPLVEALPLETIEARIRSLVKDRMEEAGESEAAAELSVVRSDEGRALWEKARQLRRVQQTEGTPSAVACSETTHPLIVIDARLESLIGQHMSASNVTRAAAEKAVIETAEGSHLWEMRREYVKARGLAGWVPGSIR